MMQHIVYDTCVYEYINGKYPYIIQNMLNDDFFIIQDKVYDVLYKITYFNEVVGFLTGDFHDDSFFVVELVYIVPKFRDIGFFTKSVDFLEGVLGVPVFLFLPNRYAIDSLLNHSFAFMITDRLLLSKFKLCFFDKCKNLVCSHVYDYTYCAIVDFNESLVSPLLDVDKRFCKDRCCDDIYFETLKNELLENI